MDNNPRGYATAPAYSPVQVDPRSYLQRFLDENNSEIAAEFAEELQTIELRLKACDAIANDIFGSSFKSEDVFTIYGYLGKPKVKRFTPQELQRMVRERDD